jgi:hypothetical protein
MVECGIERSARTILPRRAHRLDVIVTKGIQSSVEAIRRENQGRVDGDTVVEFRQTPTGQSRREFPPRP